MRVAIVDEGIDRRALLHPQRVQKIIFPDAKTGGSEMPTGGHGTDCARLLEQCADVSQKAGSRRYLSEICGKHWNAV